MQEVAYVFTYIKLVGCIESSVFAADFTIVIIALNDLSQLRLKAVQSKY